MGVIKRSTSKLFLVGCLSGLLFNCGSPRSLVTGNSGDNEVNVHVNIDGTFITELLDRINPSPSSNPTPIPSPSSSPSPTPIPTATPTPVPNLNLVAFWKGEDDALDSENDHDLQLGGNVKFKSGKVGKAFHFNGTTSFALLNPFHDIPTDTISVAFWMKSSEKNKNGTVFSYATDGNQGSNEFLLYNNQNFQVYRGKNKSVKTWVTINDGKWHHIALTWKGSNGETILYKDGLVAFSGTLAPGTSITSGGSFVLGQEQDQVGGGFDESQAFKGLIDEVRVYDKVLSQNEVLAVM